MLVAAFAVPLLRLPASRVSGSSMVGRSAGQTSAPGQGDYAAGGAGRGVSILGSGWKKCVGLVGYQALEMHRRSLMVLGRAGHRQAASFPQKLRSDRACYSRIHPLQSLERRGILRHLVAESIGWTRLGEHWKLVGNLASGQLSRPSRRIAVASRGERPDRTV